MARPRQTAEQREAVRNRVLEAAMKLMHEQGPEALSMRLISQRAGVSTMTLYAYFDGRADLIGQLLDRQRRRTEQRRSSLVEMARTGHAKAAVQQFLDFFAEAARLRPGIFRFLWVLPLPRRDDHLDARHRLERTTGQLAELIAIGIGGKEFVARDPIVAAATVVSMTHGPLILYHNGRLTDPSLLEQVHREAVGAALSYLCNP
jgi:AcrR family transcriptional regulator